MKATCYIARSSQCDNDPDITAFGYKIDTLNSYKHRYIAVSRDIEEMFSEGTKVIIRNTTYDGEYIVADRMSSRKRSRIDILINDDQQPDVFKDAEICMYKKRIVQY